MLDWFFQMEEKKRNLLTAATWGILLFAACLDLPTVFIIASLLLAAFFTVCLARAHDMDKKAEEERKAAKKAAEIAEEDEEASQQRTVTHEDFGIHIQGLHFKREEPSAESNTTVTQERIYLSTPNQVRNFLASDSYIVIDLETSGLSKNSNEIIEIAMIKIQSGQEIGRFQSLVKPYQPISSKITSITGITNEMLEAAPHFSDVADSVVSFIGDNVLIAHNSTFDMGFFVRCVGAERSMLEEHRHTPYGSERPSLSP